MGANSEEELRGVFSTWLGDERQATQFADTVFSKPETKLFAWDTGEPLVTSTILIAEYTGSADLASWVGKYVDDSHVEGVDVLDRERTRVGGLSATRVTIRDSLAGPVPIVTDAYLFVTGSELWLLEFSALSDSFDEMRSRYRESAATFQLDTS